MTDADAFDLVPGWDDPDDHDRAVVDLINAQALELQAEMIPPQRDTVENRTSWATASAARDVTAVVLNRLASALPGVTEEQRAYLTTTARAIAPDAVDADTA